MTKYRNYLLLYMCALIAGVLPVIKSSAEVKRWNGILSVNWNEANNWTPTGVPSEEDEVILDNRFVPHEYLLSLPDAGVRLYSLEITPAQGVRISCVVPLSNVAIPALNLSSLANSLILNSGANFINSSGLTSGQSLSIAGRFVIRNGGRYVHNTRASHATGIIAKLSTDAGTEKGIFEFDVPGGAYSLSLSNRNYGSLRLSSIASAGTQTYNATGTSITNIRGDLELKPGVVFNLDLERTLTIGGDLIQYGGVFNLANQPNNLQLICKGNFIADSAAVITETSTGLPTIAFEGTETQLVSVRGVILNNVGLVINNPYGIILNADLPIPYLLQLKSGNIRSFPDAMLKVADNATISNASGNSFVDGPVQKTGDEDFEFPVGRQGDYAPVKIIGGGRSVTDKYLVEYHHGNPQQQFGPTISPSSILRISSLEYWTVQKTGTSSIEKISLAVGAYSHATSLEKLIISNWKAESQAWINLGNTAFIGISSGTITSDPAYINGIYTIGTTVPDQNPLPVYFEGLTGFWKDDILSVKWKAFNQSLSDQYTLDFSDDGLTFYAERIIDADSRDGDRLLETIFAGKSMMFARLRLIAGAEKEVQSQTILIKKNNHKLKLEIFPSLAKDVVNIKFVPRWRGSLIIQLVDQHGRIILEKRSEAIHDVIALDISSIKRGVYYCRVTGPRGAYGVAGFVKL